MADKYKLVAYSQCEAEQHDQVLYVQQQLNVCTMALQNHSQKHTCNHAHTFFQINLR